MTIDWPTLLDRILILAGAYILALPIAWDRETHSRSAGLRTYPLVAIGACGFFIVGESILNDVDAQARLIQGLMGGLGFLGGGAILKREDNVSGMATAVAIWITGSIGMAVALRHFEVAITLSVISFLTLHFGEKVKEMAVEHDAD